jgi:hypothetical protein
VQINENAENREHRKRLVKLRRVQMKSVARRVENRNARIFVTGFGKMNAPRQISDFSPAASSRKTALPSEKLSQSDAGRKGVATFQNGNL